MSSLKRSLGWKVYGLYGLGNIIGAGIYVLLGEVAAEAGNGLIWSFVVAGVLATFTALSYSALAKKYPVSAGEVIYAEKAFNIRQLSRVIGLALVFSGLVSSGVLLNGFANYLDELVSVPRFLAVAGLAVILGGIAIKGIKHSAGVAVAITVAEIFGLLLIIGAAFTYPDMFANVSDAIGSSLSVGALPILFGGFLAFYAFIGFEDMVNVAEEVKDPKQNIPRGMFLAVFLSLGLYVLVSVVSLGVLSAEALGNSDAPLADVFREATNSNLPIIAIIGVFAIVNGVLAQLIMVSRVLFGLSREKMLPNWIGKVDKKTNTPINATLIMVVLIIIAAMIFPLATLASMTSFALLLIFSVVHLACLKLKDSLDISAKIPIIGLLLNTAIISVQIYNWVV